MTWTPPDENSWIRAWKPYSFVVGRYGPPVPLLVRAGLVLVSLGAQDHVTKVRILRNRAWCKITLFGNLIFAQAVFAQTCALTL